MQSHYEINVSYKGRHLFATAERSAANKVAMAIIHKVIRDKFPESEGYAVDVTFWEVRGKEVKPT